MGENSIKNNRNGQFSFQRAWEVLFPYLLFYLVFNGAYIILAFVYQAGMEYFGEGYREFMTVHALTVSSVAESLCRVIGVWPLVPMLKKELQMRAAESERGFVRERIIKLTQTVIFAVSLSLGLNVLLTLTGFAETSAAYREVADYQYGVSFGLGLILYGVVSPLTEEVVFRGIIYNRLRRFFGPLFGIVVSALFFGVFHGNLVQGVYGTVMGIFMAHVYERQGSFFRPVLFHAAANLAVYTVAHLQRVQTVLLTPMGWAILLSVAVLCVVFEEKGRER